MTSLLKDALHNTSRSATLGLQRQQQYARGLVTGVLSALMAQGMTFFEAREVVYGNLPEDLDKLALPDFILDFAKTCPPCEMFAKEQPVFKPSSGKSTEVSDAYRDLCAAFMPQVITDVSMAVTAKKALKAAKDYRPRGQRGAAVELYIVLVDRLLKDFFTGVFAEFAREGDYADKDVLQVLIESGPLSLSEAAMKSGLSEMYLEQVLAGKRPLSRLAISALSYVYGTSPAIFSHGPNLGMLRGPFKVTSHFNCYTITDTRSSRSYEIGDGVDSVKLDPDDPSDEMSVPDCFGFVEAWERDFNSDIYQTMEAYFDTNSPEVYSDDEADEEAEEEDEEDEDSDDTATAADMPEPPKTVEPAEMVKPFDPGEIVWVEIATPATPTTDGLTQQNQLISVNIDFCTTAIDESLQQARANNVIVPDPIAEYQASVSNAEKALSSSPNRRSAEVAPQREVSDRQIAILLYSLRRLQNDLHRTGRVHKAEYEGLEQPITATEIDELCQLINLGK